MPVLCDKRNHSNEKAAQHTKEQPVPATARESLRTAVKIQCEHNKNTNRKTVKNVESVIETNCSGLSV